MSRCGRLPITLQNVEVRIDDDVLVIQGKNGITMVPVSPLFKILIDLETKELKVVAKVLKKDHRYMKQLKQMWGTTRALIQNAVIGVTEGYTTAIKLQCTGCKFVLKDNVLEVHVGQSIPKILLLPEEIKCTIKEKNLIVLTAKDKVVLGNMKASIKSCRPWNCYTNTGCIIDGHGGRIKKSARGSK